MPTDAHQCDRTDAIAPSTRPQDRAISCTIDGDRAMVGATASAPQGAGGGRAIALLY
ncbi:hypothetical protein [Limnothrix redekei]|uniref:Uncharacterized protein n=1 Tax=Limnothrix redekei LRLZ20PSL1 TaxID=3112953 RepID=A0ABW7CD12_9CYAN